MSSRWETWDGEDFGLPGFTFKSTGDDYAVEADEPTLVPFVIIETIDQWWQDVHEAKYEDRCGEREHDRDDYETQRARDGEK
jgi:hypothetical protein